MYQLANSMYYSMTLNALQMIKENPFTISHYFDALKLMRKTGPSRQKAHMLLKALGCVAFHKRRKGRDEMWYTNPYNPRMSENT